MSLSLQIVLIIAAIGILILICAAIKRSKIMVEDSLFWVVFSLILVVLAIFPQIAYFFSALIGVQASSNFVFMCVIGILLIKEFRSTSKISLLKNKINLLAEEIALERNKQQEKDENQIE